jgi:ABC-type glycerol-3-phosphate transport system substrate-binding protein
MKKKSLLVLLMLVLLVVSGQLFAGGKQEAKTEGVTINIWALAGEQDALWRKVGELYKEKRPDVDFNITVQSDEFMDTNLITTYATNPTNVDFATFWTGSRIYAMVKNDSVLNLDPWFNQYNWDSKLLPGYRANKMPGFGNASFCSDWMTHSEVFFNRSIFDKLGVKPPDTIDGFFTLCDKVKAAGVQPIAMGGKDAWPLHMVYNQMLARYMSASDVVDKFHMWYYDPNKSAQTAEIYRSAPAIKAWQFMADLNARGYYGEGVNSLDFNDATEIFQSGEAAMYFGFSWTPSTIKSAVPDFKIDYFIMPPYQGNTAIPTEFMNVIVFPKNLAQVKQPILADMLNELVTNESYIIEALLKTGKLPTSKTISDPNKIVQYSGEPLLARLIADVDKMGTVTITDDWLAMELIKEYYDLCMSVTEGTVSPKEAGESMYQVALEILKTGR